MNFSQTNTNFQLVSIIQSQTNSLFSFEQDHTRSIIPYFDGIEENYPSKDNAMMVCYISFFLTIER